MTRITLESAEGHLVTVEADARDTGMRVRAADDSGDERMTFISATELREYVLRSVPITEGRVT